MSDTPFHQLDEILDGIEAAFPDSIERLSRILAIPSVSTDPDRTDEVHRAAIWFRDELDALGFEAKVVETPGHPVVLASSPAPEGAPTILFYGHYDVQPEDPIDLWDSPPFEATVVEDSNGGRIVARGAVDDKGQVMCFIEAFRAWRSTVGTLPVGVTVMLEGEEESGSPSLEGFLDAHHDDLRADVCVVSDTGMWNAETPAITTMLRGMVYLDVAIDGPTHDLHSGMYGGAIANPANVLAAIIAAMHDASGGVAIPGFYDDIVEPDAETLESWSKLDFDEAAFLGSAGVTAATGGERDRSVLERTWSRPTLDANGIHGGYTAAGAKTIIPATCAAKISCRLVPGQDPDRIEQLVMDFVTARLPEGFTARFESHGSNPAIVVPPDSPWLAAANDGLERVYGRPAAIIGTGGSIPAVGEIQQRLSMDALLVGFGLDDDRVHSPNEKFDLRCYRGGIRAHAAMLAAFAGTSAP